MLTEAWGANVKSVLHRSATALVAAVGLACAGCSASPADPSLPEPPAAVGDDYPGTCMPASLTWPTDFLESLPSETTGPVVGLRLEYIDGEWAWRVRSPDSKEDGFGERVDDPSFGKETLLDVRTLEILGTQEVELTEAEQQVNGAGAYAAAEQSGEQWPSPLIVEMARVMDGGTPVWQITTCDTATNEHSVMTVN